MLLPNLPAPESGIRHRQPNIQAFINQESIGNGTLYIAESRVTWAKEGENNGLSLEYPHIAIHAVSRDEATFPHPCIYLMIDCVLNNPTANAVNGHQDAESDSDNDDEEGMTEVRFVPSDTMSLEPMYKALNECQALHPDPEDQPSDEEWPAGDDEDEGHYDVTENGDLPQDNMDADMDGVRNGRGHQDSGDGGDEDEDMETGQFDDADM